MEEKFKWLLSAALGALATFGEQYGLLIVLVVVAIIFDVVTGVIKASVTEGLNSNKGTKGFFKKLALLVALFFGFFLDMAISYMLIRINIGIDLKMPFGLIIGFYIVLNECISIAENLVATNPSVMPRWIIEKLSVAKDELDKDSKESENNEDIKEK